MQVHGENQILLVFAERINNYEIRESVIVMLIDDDLAPESIWSRDIYIGFDSSYPESN